jgi:hypothetical protein
VKLNLWLFKHPEIFRWMANIYPPVFFSGIKVTYLSPDYTECEVKLKNWPGTRNANGTQFGGSLFSMSDIVYGSMLFGILGPEKYFVWDKKSRIEFLSPGRGQVRMVCKISKQDIEEIKTKTAKGDKYFPTFTATIYDRKNNAVAIIYRTLYVRLRPEYRKDTKNIIPPAEEQI